MLKKLTREDLCVCVCVCVVWCVCVCVCSVRVVCVTEGPYNTLRPALKG